jgi:hypothetical protein
VKPVRTGGYGHRESETDYSRQFLNRPCASDLRESLPRGPSTRRIVVDRCADSRRMPSDCRCGSRTAEKEGLLEVNDIIMHRLAKVNLTESQRRDAINYEPGQVIQFDKRAKGGFRPASNGRSSG